MRPFLLLALLCCCLLSIQCKATSGPSGRGVDQVYGTWNWIESRGGFTGDMVRTPASVGYQVQLRFHKDGTFETLHDGSVYESGRFTITRKSSLFDDAWVIDLDVPGRIPLVVLEATDDSLRLGDDATDLFTHIYSRAE